MPTEYVMQLNPIHRVAWCNGCQAGCAGRALEFSAPPWYDREHKATHHAGFAVGERVRRELRPQHSIPIMQAVSYVCGLHHALSLLFDGYSPDERTKWHESAPDKYQMMTRLVDDIVDTLRQIDSMLNRGLACPQV